MVFESKLFFASKFNSHVHRKQSHLAKCPAAPFVAQWHLCGFTSTSSLSATNILSLWSHRAWPIFRSGHFSILPRKDSSSSSCSLCTFPRTYVDNVYNWWGFIAIYAVLLLNLLFTLFCREIYFATIYVLSCGEKLSRKVHLWRKHDIYQVWVWSLY